MRSTFCFAQHLQFCAPYQTPLHRSFITQEACILREFTFGFRHAFKLLISQESLKVPHILCGCGCSERWSSRACGRGKVDTCVIESAAKSVTSIEIYLSFDISERTHQIAAKYVNTRLSSMWNCCNEFLQTSSKSVSVLAIKVYGEDSSILKLGTKCSAWSHSHPITLPPGREPLMPIV